MPNRLTAWARRVVRSLAGLTAEEHIGVRTRARVGHSVTPDTALRNSAVWAACRIRADLISTFPVDVFRKVGDARLSVPTPRVLVEPGGPSWDYQDWMYATQFDLDRTGNTLGLITAKDGMELPAEIVPVGLNEWTVRETKTEGLKYRVRNEDYRPDQVWHERQYVVSGLPVGLSPVAYAAWVISENISTQQFAEAWFGRGAVPSAHLRNTAMPIPDQGKAEEIKQKFLASVQVGQPFVTGSDWEYKPLQAEQMGMEWLEDRKFSLTDISRYFGVPADLIDAAVSGESVTYANITERNLQFLIMHLGPAVARREKNLSKLTAAPRFVKLNTDALLRMDPLNRARSIDTQLKNGTLTNAEARALDDRPPLTPEEQAEYLLLYGKQRAEPAAAVSL